ncbi:MAG: TIGR03936 family radical SAM-associated protein [Halanaerobiales bacterium]
MKIRIEFSKLDGVKYISHLELMDTIRRGLRRANFPVSYSKGYNPHIQLSLGQPLAVGMVGMAEYFDLDLEKKIEIDKFISGLNQSLPPSICINKARYVPDDVKSLQAVVNTAVYLIKMDFKKNIDEERTLNGFVNFPEIRVVRRRRNKKDRIYDLKPMLYNASVRDDNIWEFTVSTGSSGNVRPSEIIKALSERYDEINEVPLVNVIREEMLVKKGNKFYKPFDDSIVRS